MASLNVAEWSPEQVSEWLSGVEGNVSQYAPRLKARGLDGRRLLALRCDDLHYLGVHVIGHQELLLEAVEQLRHFHYEMRRECVQQLAVRVSVAGAGLARALRGGGGGAGAAGGALETQALADVARLVSAVKPLACWLARWPLVSVGALSERKAALLKLALEAATCAQRDRFADQPARAIAAAAAAAAATADYIIQEVSDPGILSPASLESVCVPQGDKPLGFALLPSACQRHQLAHVRFGSPAHASGQVHDGDEIVMVGEQCVVGWGGGAIEGLCRVHAARTGDLPLKLRRRGARPPPPARPARLPAPPPAPLPTPVAPPHPPADPGTKADSSDESDALSPPASPSHLHLDHTRMYPPRPRGGWAGAGQRRHSVSGGSPLAKRATLSIEQFWRELREQHWSGDGGGGGGGGGADDKGPLYRHKAVSCSTGLELSPRPRTCLGVGVGTASPAAHPAPPSPRGKLDKSHSTPAYSLEAGDTDPLPPHTPIPESPTIEVNGPNGNIIPLSVINGFDEPPTEALNPLFSEASPMAVVSAVNPLAISSPCPAPVPPSRAAAPPSPPPRPRPRPPVTHSPQHSGEAPLTPVRDFPALKIVPRQTDTSDKKEFSPLKPLHNARTAEISLPLPLRHLAKMDLAGGAGAGSGSTDRLPPLNQEPEPAPAPAGGGHTPSAVTTPEHTTVTSSSGGGGGGHSTSRGLFPSAKTRSLKKKNSLLAKRRSVPWRTICSRGASTVGATGAAVTVGAAGGGCEAAGAVWQRVRARGAALPRWARRYLLLVHNVLYAYRSPECTRATCMIQLGGWVVCGAGEVRSRAHAFKVYHTGRAAYFAADTPAALHAWIHLLTKATLAQHAADPSQQYSETDYSETESDAESSERHERDRDSRRERDKDKSKFGSLKKLTSRMSRSESSETVGAASLDRKYLRIFSRKPKIKAAPVPVPTEHYRSYRRVSPSSPCSPASHPAAPLSPLTPLTPLSPLTPGSPVAPPAQDTQLQAAAKLKAARYAHVSNPNLAGVEWRGPPAPGPARRGNDHFLGFVTLEEFMLKKQEEERKQVYTNRVLMGIERPVIEGSRTHKEIQKQLDKIVPDVIYGELPDTLSTGPVVQGGGVGHRALPPEPAPKPPPPASTAHGGSKPISIKGKDGYEKIVYPEDLPSSGGGGAQGGPLTPDRWRDSLRRNHKVHSGGAEGSPRLSHLTPSPAPATTSSPTPAPAPAHTPATSPPNANNTSDSSSNGAPPGGVSRLRLMFSSRSASRDHSNSSHSQLSTPSPQHVHLQHQHTHSQESTSPSPEGFPSPRRPSEAPPAPLSGGLSTATYPHLQCPPTFQPETYCLSRPQPRPPHTPHARRHQHKQ